MANFHISHFRVFLLESFRLIFSWWQFPETHPTERVKHHGHRWCPMISFLKWKPSAVSKVQSKYFQTRLKNVWLFRSLYYLPLAWLCLLWNFQACLSPYLTRPPWVPICLEGGSCLFPKELSGLQHGSSSNRNTTVKRKYLILIKMSFVSTVMN